MELIIKDNIYINDLIKLKYFLVLLLLIFTKEDLLFVVSSFGSYDFTRVKKNLSIYF